MSENLHKSITGYQRESLNMFLFANLEWSTKAILFYLLLTHHDYDDFDDEMRSFSRGYPEAISTFREEMDGLGFDLETNQFNLLALHDLSFEEWEALNFKKSIQKKS